MFMLIVFLRIEHSPQLVQGLPEANVENVINLITEYLRVSQHDGKAVSIDF